MLCPAVPFAGVQPRDVRDGAGLDAGGTPRISIRSEALASVAEHRASAMIVVPIMLRRILDLGPTALAGHDLSALRIVFVGGSQLGAALATRAIEALGPVVYNMYGSTEVAYATVATPEDLAVEPGCVGGVVPGSIVKVFIDGHHEAPPGHRGGSSSATCGLRGIHRRRHQGVDPGPDGHRRRRSFRSDRAGCSSTVATTR